MIRPDEPHLIWIMVDQLAASYAKSRPGMITPGLDALAQRGTTFEQAYCAHPICVPSRTSMITGLMPHQTGVMFNTDQQSFQGESVATCLKRAGYQTGYIGKWHIPRSSSHKAWHGFDFMREGSRSFHDEHFVGACKDFISLASPGPLFLTVSFTNPHDICEWARQLEGGFDAHQEALWNGEIGPLPPDEALPELPANFPPSSLEPPVIREHQQNGDRGTYPVLDWTQTHWRRYLWGYERLVEKVDAEIVRLLALLDRTGIAENAVMLFVSDHGDGCAAHHWNQKTLLYEECTRVPLILVDPRIPGGRMNREHLVQTGEDIAATLCDYAQASLPEGCQGVSLRQAVESPNLDTRRQTVITQTDLHRTYGASGEVYGRMVRWDRYKYIVYSHGEPREQLFDLATDPGEATNLIGNPAFAKLLDQARHRLYQTCDAMNDPCLSWLYRASQLSAMKHPES